MNVISITGNITRDAETRKAGDSIVTSFGLAENTKVKGEQVAIFYDCSMWGERGQKIAEYLLKGGQITVIGELMPPRVKGERVYVDIRVNNVSLPKSNKAAANEAW